MEKVASHINEMQKIYEDYGTVFDQLVADQSGTEKEVREGTTCFIHSWSIILLAIRCFISSWGNFGNLFVLGFLHSPLIFWLQKG